MIQPFKHEQGKAVVLKSYDQILALWPAPYQESDIETQFGTTHVITAGNRQNPPLLLLHGVNDNSAVMWVYNIEFLARHFFTIAVDTLGAPNKSVPGENYAKNKFNQTTWLNELTAKLNLERFYIAGVSYGGYLAFDYTLKEPQKIIKCISMAGILGTPPLQGTLIMLKMFLPEALFPTKGNIKRLMKKLCGADENPFEKEPLLFEHLYLMMKHSNQKAMFVHKLTKPDDREILAVKDKLYFMIGDHDFVKERREAFKYMEKMELKYKIIAKAGHGLNHEQPEVVNREIYDFFLGDKL